MPRPTSKAQLLEYSATNYEKLQAEIAKLTPEEMVEAGTVGEWSVKDVLAHLYEWQRMVRSWYAIGKRGENPITPSEAYTWKEIPALNQHIYETYRDIELDNITEKLATSHAETLREIDGMSDEELFTPKIYKWTKSTTLGSYYTSATSSHYDWARKEIRKGMKAKKV